MRVCTRLGLNLGWRCNWRCAHCFYLRNVSLHSDQEMAPSTLKMMVDAAAVAGFDHVVMIGFGEPLLSANCLPAAKMATDAGLAFSIISNGAVGARKVQDVIDAGINHFHLSSHGVGPIADRITGMIGGDGLQLATKRLLARYNVPFRTNLTMQRMNYQHMSETVQRDLDEGSWHIVLLGFLPHYEWATHVNEVAVHPAELRGPLQEAARLALASHGRLTIRYHPFCHLDSDLWKYVVNARYVPYDPWEWAYTSEIKDEEAVWRNAVAMGQSVANREPCIHCPAYGHCGGWNRFYAEAWPNKCNIKPIKDIPAEYAAVWDQRGGLHDLNPMNQLSGTITRPECISGTS